MTPLETFRAWYNNQPRDVRWDIAASVVATLPLYGKNGKMRHPLRPDRVFEEWLCDPRRGIYQRVGRVVLVRGLIPLVVFRNKKTRADWEEADERRRAMVDSFAPGELSWKALEMRKPSRTEEVEQWLQSSKSWEQLCNSSLSDEALEAWIYEELHRPTRQCG